MTAAWLTDNRQPRPPRLRPRARAARRGAGRQAPAPGAPPARWWARCAPRWPTSSASRPGVVVVTGHPRPPLRRGRLGGGARLPDPPRHQHDVVDQLPGADEEDRRRAPDRLGPGPAPGPATWSPTTTTPAGCACSGCATTSSRPTTPVRPATGGGAQLRRPDRRWPPRRRPGAGTSCSPRGWPASARRSTTATPGAGSTTCRSPPPGPIWCGPCSKAWPTTAGGCTTRSSASPSAASTPCGSSAAAPRRTCGARSTPTSWAAPSNGWPSRCTPTCAARRCSPALALGDVALEEIDALVARRRPLRARPGDTRRPTTASTPSSPGSTGSQKPMFARLNRHRKALGPSTPIAAILIR